MLNNSESQSPIISVCMSVYNAENTVYDAINSIVNQTFKDWELIIIDDGSTDNSVDVINSIKDSRIKFYSDGYNKGLAIRLNQAIDLAGGEYIARMDADDISYIDRFSEQLKWMKEHEECDLVSSKVVVFDDGYTAVGGFAFKGGHHTICQRPWSGFNMPHPTWFGRIEWFKRFGYNKKSFKSEDQEMLLRGYLSSEYCCINKVLLGYRQDSFSVRKETLTRISKIKDFSIYFFTKHHYFLAIKSMFFQVLKWQFSVVSIILPFTERLLKHRALPLTSEEEDEWKKQCVKQHLTSKFI